MANKAKKDGEKIIKDADVDAVVEVMRELDDEGTRILVEGVTQELSETKKKQLVAQLKDKAVKTDAAVKGWLVNAIGTTYVAGMTLADKQIKKFGINILDDVLNIEILKSAPDLSPHLEAVNSLLSDAYLDFGQGITGFVRGSEHILNDTIRRQVQQKIATGALTGDSIRQITGVIENQLKDRGLEVMLDRGGKQWTAKRYSEMLSRTHVVKAHNEARVNRAANYDIDIVEVSDHFTEDEICERYEGEIYSLSGKSKNYPKLPSMPPFHPNCAHSLLLRPDLS